MQFLQRASKPIAFNSNAVGKFLNVLLFKVVT